MNVTIGARMGKILHSMYPKYHFVKRLIISGIICRGVKIEANRSERARHIIIRSFAFFLVFEAMIQITPALVIVPIINMNTYIKQSTATFTSHRGFSLGVDPSILRYETFVFVSFIVLFLKRGSAVPLSEIIVSFLITWFARLLSPDGIDIRCWYFIGNNFHKE